MRPKRTLLNRITASSDRTQPIGSRRGRVPIEKELRPCADLFIFIALLALLVSCTVRSRVRRRRGGPPAPAAVPPPKSTPRQEDQGRPGHRHRRPQRPLVQPARQRGPRARQVRARRRGPRADLQGELGLRAEPLDARAAEVRPRDRRRLPDGRGDEHRRREVPGHEVRDHRRRRDDARSPSPRTSQGLLFKEQEAGYLVGYMAGLYAKDEGGGHGRLASAARRSRRSTTTSPATRPAPRRPTRTSKTLNGYSQDFVDPAKCKELALNQIAAGREGRLPGRRQCGLGALDAAKEKSVQGIGVDADQALPRRPRS